MMAIKLEQIVFPVAQTVIKKKMCTKNVIVYLYLIKLLNKYTTAYTLAAVSESLCNPNKLFHVDFVDKVESITKESAFATSTMTI